MLTVLFVFFFLMLLRPPRFTLFPYTTLFRSNGVIRRCRSRSERRPSSRHSGQRHPACRDDGRRSERDRKSTRLNSSHLGISYAVFCLKKKKKQSNSRICEVRPREV